MIVCLFRRVNKLISLAQQRCNHWRWRHETWQVCRPAKFEDRCRIRVGLLIEYSGRHCGWCDPVADAVRLLVSYIKRLDIARLMFLSKSALSMKSLSCLPNWYLVTSLRRTFLRNSDILRRKSEPEVISTKAIDVAEMSTINKKRLDLDVIILTMSAQLLQYDCNTTIL